MTDEELLKELEKRAEAYNDRIKRDFAIEELTKIKDEIEMNQNLYYHDKKTDTYEDIIKTDTVLKVIDNHIEELKGE